MSETAFQIATRKTIETDIVDSANKHDSDQVNAKLDIHPYGRERPLLGAVAMWQALKSKGSKAARFFEKEALDILAQPTEEIPVVTPEMLDAA